MIKKERVFNDIRNGEISGLRHRIWKKTGTVNYKQAATKWPQNVLIEGKNL